MEFQGKMIQFLGETGGTSKTGNPWKKKEWLIETFGNFPKKVKVQCFGDRSDNIHMEPNKDYNLHVDLESREYNGRWYTDISVFRVEEIQGAQQQFIQPGNNINGPYQVPNPGGYNNTPGVSGDFINTQISVSEDDSDEDLPF